MKKEIKLAPAPKFKINDMVYNYQSPNVKARVSRINKSKDPRFEHSYLLTLYLPNLLTRSSKWTDESSLSRKPLKPVERKKKMIWQDAIKYFKEWLGTSRSLSWIDVDRLDMSDLNYLASLAKAVGYKKPKNANASTGVNFLKYLTSKEKK